MNKKALLIALIFTMTICFIPISPISVEAASTVPIITSPVQYDEIDPYSTLTITWTAPTSGSVSRYIVSVRELRVKDKPTGDLLVDQRIVPFVNTSTTVSDTLIKQRGYYRASVCAVLSDGTYHYSAERYFYSGISKGVASGKCISFKIYTGFTEETKNAIYYSSRTWVNSIGAELVNTYPYSQGVTTTTFNNNDGVNTIVPYTDVTGSVMSTQTNLSYDYQTVEVDMRLNKAYSWSNNLTSGTHDVQNVVTHEMGHAHGLVDKYDSYASSWTMYYSTSPCETIKRDLTQNDILSAKRLNGLA